VTKPASFGFVLFFSGLEHVNFVKTYIYINVMNPDTRALHVQTCV